MIGIIFLLDCIQPVIVGAVEVFFPLTCLRVGLEIVYVKKTAEMGLWDKQENNVIDDGRLVWGVGVRAPTYLVHITPRVGCERR